MNERPAPIAMDATAGFSRVRGSLCQLGDRFWANCTKLKGRPAVGDICPEEGFFFLASHKVTFRQPSCRTLGCIHSKMGCLAKLHTVAAWVSGGPIETGRQLFSMDEDVQEEWTVKLHPLDVSSADPRN